MLTDPGNLASRLSPALALNRKLRDVKDNLDQMIPGLITNADGTVQLCAATLTPGQVDTDPYPKVSPSMRLRPPLSERQLRQQNHRLLSEIEGEFATYGQAGIEDANGAMGLARANFAGYLAQHPFQFTWSGTRRQWVFLGGTVRWAVLDYITGKVTYSERSLDRQHLTPVNSPGWAVLELGVQPKPWDSQVLQDHPDAQPQAGYDMTVGTLSIVQSPAQHPPTLSISAQGYQNEAEGTLSRTWTSGRYQIPLARLTPPGSNGRKSALIEPIVTRDLNFSLADAAWNGSLPQIP